jgi:hypothetical protein
MKKLLTNKLFAADRERLTGNPLREGLPTTRPESNATAKCLLAMRPSQGREFGSKHCISFGLHDSEGAIWQWPSRLKV